MTGATAPEDDSIGMPRALLVFAHPDDESIALGARLGRFRAAHLVHVTDGAPRNGQDSQAHGFASLEEYRRARMEELGCALRSAGLSRVSRECLEIPDQEAALQLLQLTRKVESLLQQRRPEVVFTHPYEGGHPDHDACAFAVHHAVAMLKNREEACPAVVEAAFYHIGPQGIATGSFLPGPQNTLTAEYCLSPEEQERKRSLLACFTTQQETLRSFALEWERFRIAPEYDFGRPPHAAPVFYDQFPWGMTSRRFCDLARETERQLRKEAVAVCR